MKKESIDTNRRNFLKKTAGVVGFGIVATSFMPFLTSCEQDETPPKPDEGFFQEVNIAQYSQLSSPGGMLKITLQGINAGSPIVIYRFTEGAFLVLDGLCRHRNAELELPTAAHGELVCSLHKVTFSPETGEIINLNGQSASSVPALIFFNSEYVSSSNVLKIFAV
jgi:nitrite reductase/ring-hydroxylating ferredoxin subunit